MRFSTPPLLTRLTPAHATITISRSASLLTAVVTLATTNFRDSILGSIIGGGLGIHVIDRPNTTLDVLGGLSWTRQAYIGNVIKSFPSAQIGETFTKHLFANTDFKQRGFFYPDLTNSSQYNAALDAGLNTKVYKRLSWQLTFSDRYTSFPLPGKKNNDLLFSTGVGISVGSAAK